MTFRALLIDSGADGISHSVTELTDDRLPAGDVTVEVEYSSLNYKDGMVLAGQGRLVRDYPHVPGIDMAGTVSASDDPRWKPGDAVVLTGWRVGEVWWGGYSTRARVKGDWLTALPAGLTARRAMAVGTAGFTSMLAVDELERHGLTPGTGPVVVTGASGGVGSAAVHFLARLGYEVVASTGRAAERTAELTALGAASVIDRSELEPDPGRPMLSERWAGCVDAVGGTTLAHVIAELRYGAAAAACGLTGGTALATTVIPFLLRGVSLLGIDSVACPSDRRTGIWQRVASTADMAALDSMTTEIGLDDLPHYGNEILAGRTAGRVVVRTA